jgi:serine/threonine protein kinase/CHASE2 domain-containing sensor protein
MAIFAVAGAIATSLDIGLVQLFERQAQTVFFQIRGKVSAPQDIVILAIDEQSLDQGEIYTADPDAYPYLEPLQSWPWQRRAYAIAIERLMQAGVRSVALDLIFDTPSTWGAADDEALEQMLQRYSNRVALAASYEDQVIQGQGTITQIIEPLPLYQNSTDLIGSINFWIEWNGRIHRLSQEFPILLAQQYPEQAQQFQALGRSLPSFEQAALQAANLPVSEPRGGNIFFYGPQETFAQYPFWQILDEETWQNHLASGRFKDKIVLVGPTATLFQDMHATPFGKMPGVEVHANAIATLMNDRAIATLLPHQWMQGLLIFIGTLGLGILISQPQPASARFRRTIVVALVWGVVGGAIFIHAGMIVPTAVPMLVLLLGGISYVGTSLAGENLRKLKLRSTLKQYASSPIIQEILSQQDDFQDLLEEREKEALGKLLGDRYQIMEILGAGGFGETYIAADTKRPGNPLCVAKRLRPTTNDPKLMKLARRLFQREAETLERLGKHDQIPQLLAYFEEDNEFYLVQEFIDGHPLREELMPNQSFSEKWVVELLRESLSILQFIHQCGVIHRDIKPSNIIRRHADNRLVFIDFGAVKEIHGSITEDSSEINTVGIGTRGYMPNEQCAGNPRFSSDLYAVGIVGVQALTGLSPDRLAEDPRTGEIVWQSKANVGPELAAILTKMIRYDFNQRYRSVEDVIADLDQLTELSDECRAPHPLMPLPTTPEQAQKLIEAIRAEEDEDEDYDDDQIAPTLFWHDNSSSGQSQSSNV